VPLNPAFSSLNLAQSVLVIGYEWFTAVDATPPSALPLGERVPATKAQLQGFFEHLEEALDRSGFLRNLAKRPSMVRNIRNLFQRANCTEQEVRSLHGMVTALAGPRDRAKPET
jgi:tRNA/rRNA methyltransferase